MQVPAIECDGLSKIYRGGRGLHDLDLTVEGGEIFGFLGPNGAGKTTTIRTLMGFLHPTSGSARILGLDIEKESLAIRQRVGNLPDNFAFDERMTGEAALHFFARIRGIGDISYALELAKKFDADLKTRISRLSRGNRQKVALLLTMFFDPELLIFDEPTNGLDPLMQEAFLVLVDEWKARGRTVFVSSHDLSEVERMCDRVGFIRDGRLAATETVSELMRRSIREVSVTFDDQVDPTQFARIPGVSDLHSDGMQISFRVSENIDLVVKELARHRVVDVGITHPTLDEIFLTYYGDD